MPRKSLDRARLFLKNSREQHSAISPIIATLLLILIAIAAGVIVYLYVVGFIGSTSQNNGGTISIISIENACISASTKCTGNNAYQIVILNQGSNAIAGGASVNAELYFTDSTNGASGSVTCNIASSVSPQATYTCMGASWAGIISPAPAQGDNVQVKIVNPDGGTSISSPTPKAIP